MKRLCNRLLAGLVVTAAIPVAAPHSAAGQEKSVRPGINQPFEDPDVMKFVGVFEGESREIFAKRKEIVAACKLKAGMAVGDIGAGTGLFTRLFAVEVGDKGKVYAVDIARKFIDHIEKTCKEQGIKNVTGMVCTQTSIELPPKSIDLAFICDTYHHFEFPAKTMHSVHRALRPEGRVVLVDFKRVKGVSSEWVMNHVRAGQDTFTKEIEAAGFKVVEERSILKDNYCIVFQKIDPARTKSQQDTDINQRFIKTEAMIPMRDGVRLNAAIYVPRQAKGALPFLLLRTPYGIEGAPARTFQGDLKELANDGYLFVFQDIRGRFKSEGQFVMNRPPRNRSDPKAIDESTDTYDTIEWLLKNVPNHNGRVGMLGISYGGWLTAMALLDPHPALRAVSPQASPADMFLGDDFHHNGAFRLSYGFEYVAMMETSKVNTNFKFDRHDTYEWYLRLGALGNVNARFFHGKMPTWNDFVAHPNYDAFWQKQAFASYLNRDTVPTLNVAGWWDQEDFYGPLKIYELLERHDTRHLNYLVVGPWNHGGWASGEGKSLGNIAFGSATGRYFREKVQAPWFAHFLKDKGKLDEPEALMFETGSNKWVAYDQWPPRRGVTDRKLYFHSEGRLSFQAPPDGPARRYDSYVSDPTHPVPYRPRPVEPTYPGNAWPIWLVEDQRFVHLRPDLLSWETEPLQEDVVIAGDVVARLFASTSGTDSDWVVKLIDVYPEDYPKDPKMGGYQLMVAGEVFRARFRRSFQKPQPVKPHEVNEYTIDLHWHDHCFQRGHKIMVQVQSSWFPVIDRNPQKFVENIFEAKDSDYQRAKQRVYRSRRFPSHVLLPARSESP